MAFLEWSCFEYIFVRESLLLCLLHFAPDSEKSLIQSIRSSNPSNRLKGVRNAVWDLLLVRDWVKRVQKQSDENRVWILCSRDAQLQRLARLVIHTDMEKKREELFFEMLTGIGWSKNISRQITKIHFELMGKTESSKRACKRDGFDAHCPEFLQNLEQELCC